MAQSARKSSPIHDHLASVKWLVPSAEPDTSELDDKWSEEPAPRYSFIALASPRSERSPASSAHSPRSTLRATELAYDVWDSPRALLVLVDLPGVDSEQLSLSLGGHALFLEVAAPAATSTDRPGIASGRHELCVEMPDGLRPDAIDASLSQGVLRVHISKQHAGTRRIPIVATD